MKFTQKILVAIAALALTVPAFGQLDTFGPTRTIVLAPAQNLTVSATATVTNGPIDTHGFDGVATIDLLMLTNTVGTLSATLEQSVDATNWTAFPNYALGVATSVNYTNSLGGTNLVATDNYLLPGTLTTPTASTAGWATPYIVPALFTNTGAISTLSANGYVHVGYVIGDAQRYLHIIWTPKGTTTTNVEVGALLTGRKAQ